MMSWSSTSLSAACPWAASRWNARSSWIHRAQYNPTPTTVTAAAEQDSGDADQTNDVSFASAAGSGNGGAQLWMENCMRCHNLRQPRERSDREWDIIVHHMRVRANLTAEEHRLIVAFLKSAN